MRAMFLDASAFNQDISAWDVSSSTDFYWMFQNSGVASGLSGCNRRAIALGWWENSLFRDEYPSWTTAQCSQLLQDPCLGSQQTAVYVTITIVDYASEVGWSLEGAPGCAEAQG